jgi:hypothetical protein
VRSLAHAPQGEKRFIQHGLQFAGCSIPDVRVLPVKSEHASLSLVASFDLAPIDALPLFRFQGDVLDSSVSGLSYVVPFYPSLHQFNSERICKILYLGHLQDKEAKAQAADLLDEWLWCMNNFLPTQG